MPRSSSDTSWLFFEEKNVSHRVREPHEWYQVHLSFLSHFKHKKIGDTDTNSILTPHLLVFIRFHHQQDTRLTCCWPPGRSSSATAATTFATRALREESKPPLFSVSPFLSFLLSTSDDTAWPLLQSRGTTRVTRTILQHCRGRLRLNSQLDWSNCVSRKAWSWSFIHTLPY